MHPAAQTAATAGTLACDAGRRRHHTSASRLRRRDMDLAARRRPQASQPTTRLAAKALGSRLPIRSAYKTWVRLPRQPPSSGSQGDANDEAAGGEPKSASEHETRILSPPVTASSDHLDARVEASDDTKHRRASLSDSALGSSVASLGHESPVCSSAVSTGERGRDGLQRPWTKSPDVVSKVSTGRPKSRDCVVRRRGERETGEEEDEEAEAATARPGSIAGGRHGSVEPGLPGRASPMPGQQQEPPSVGSLAEQTPRELFGLEPRTLDDQDHVPDAGAGFLRQLTLAVQPEEALGHTRSGPYRGHRDHLTYLAYKDQGGFDNGTGGGRGGAGLGPSSSADPLPGRMPKRGWDANEPGEDGSRDGPKKPRGSAPGGAKQHAATQAAGLVCPFRKRSPTKFLIRDHKLCAMTPFPDLSALKKHIRHYHSSGRQQRQQRQQHADPALVCQRCSESFASAEALGAHVSRPGSEVCEPRTPAQQMHDPEDGISPEVDRRLASRSAGGRVTDWASLWGIIFGQDDPVKDSVFVPVVELDEVRDVFDRRLPGIIANLLDDLHNLCGLSSSSTLPQTIGTIASRVDGAIRDVLEDCKAISLAETEPHSHLQDAGHFPDPGVSTSLASAQHCASSFPPYPAELLDSHEGVDDSAQAGSSTAAGNDLILGIFGSQLFDTSIQEESMLPHSLDLWCNTDHAVIPSSRISTANSATAMTDNPSHPQEEATGFFAGPKPKPHSKSRKNQMPALLDDPTARSIVLANMRLEQPARQHQAQSPEPARGHAHRLRDSLCSSERASRRASGASSRDSTLSEPGSASAGESWASQRSSMTSMASMASLAGSTGPSRAGSLSRSRWDGSGAPVDEAKAKRPWG